MFPGVNGFHWSPVHVVFLAIFFTAIGVVLATVAAAMRRSKQKLRAGGGIERIRWEADFHELPASERRCRHELNGEVKQRQCPNAFDCRQCEQHARFLPPLPGTDDIFGMSYPPDRYYHRGHTWVRPAEEGTLEIGLDDLGSRILGAPDVIELPDPGTKLAVNGPAWRVSRNGVSVRILSPVDGEVIEAGGAGHDWRIKVKPAAMPADLRHLLRGAEVKAWVGAELDRLQLLFSPSGVGPSLADGGVMVEDLPKEKPDADWDFVLGRMFMEP